MEMGLCRTLCGVGKQTTLHRFYLSRREAQRGSGAIPPPAGGTVENKAVRPQQEEHTMRKALILALSLVMVCALAACGGTDGEDGNTSTTPEQSNTVEQESAFTGADEGESQTSKTEDEADQQEPASPENGIPSEPVSTPVSEPVSPPELPQEETPVENDNPAPPAEQKTEKPVEQPAPPKTEEQPTDNKPQEPVGDTVHTQSPPEPNMNIGQVPDSGDPTDPNSSNFDPNSKPGYSYIPGFGWMENKPSEITDSGMNFDDIMNDPDFEQVGF